MASSDRTLSRSHSFEWLFCIVACLLVVGCSREPLQEQLSGATMGTTWHLTYVVTPGTPDADF
ncbi:MAG: hypothetical protein KDI09_05730, partial [Halioglobus sp.]|nr:hypothetical protein [Halioglobus sp.]